MDLRTKWFAGLARQLAHPSGQRGRLVGAMLNSRNRGLVTEAVDALSLALGSTVADLGFGGGVGLGRLLDAVGDAGQVHGIEVSETMLTSAARGFRGEIAEGRLRLHLASIQALPFQDDCLDGAITVNTIYFIDDLDAAFAELERVMKVSARVVVGLADPAAMAHMPFTAYGFRTRPLAEVTEALERAGLTVEDDRRVGEGAGAYHLLVAGVSVSS